MEISDEFSAFLLRAKRATYASGAEPEDGPRLSSHDLPYREGEWSYLDSYLGGRTFIGEEAVWKGKTAVWGMNYFGWMETEDIPQGFSPFLKHALMAAPPETPLRGPQRFTEGVFDFFCTWEGDLRHFQGKEQILFRGTCIYQLVFHGGFLLD